MKPYKLSNFTGRGIQTRIKLKDQLYYSSMYFTIKKVKYITTETQKAY